mmetsp:Transcript_20410/g.40407  ORF Transcript_20410/g.40407 Transcript_20410/m.40407 type:complete len:132 (-) Transcript_20410:239-634(-)
MFSASNLSRRAPQLAARQVRRRFGTGSSAPGFQQKVHNKEYATTPKVNGMAGLYSSVYQNVFRSMPMYTAFVVFGGVVGMSMYDDFTDYLWDSINRGKQYHEVIGKFPEFPPGCEPDEDEDEDEEEEEEEE